MDVPSRFLHQSWSRRRAGIAGRIAAFSGCIQGKIPGLGQRHLGAGYDTLEIETRNVRGPRTWRK
jgi:hypothetical protein